MWALATGQNGRLRDVSAMEERSQQQFRVDGIRQAVEGHIGLQGHGNEGIRNIRSGVA